MSLQPILTNHRAWWRDDHLRQNILADYRLSESQAVERLLANLSFEPAATQAIRAEAERLVQAVRQSPRQKTGLNAFLQAYQLSTHEGIALMCLAEALLRIPDAKTRDRLIADKIGGGDWGAFVGRGNSWLVSASAWGLMLTGGVVNLDQVQTPVLGLLAKVVARLGEPVIRVAMAQAMQIMGQQFVMGETIESALVRSVTPEHRHYRYSFDMLGEAAKTQEDAERYFRSYQHAIETVGQAAKMAGPIRGPGISVKLSALHPRFEWLKRERVIPELSEKLITLCVLAKRHDINLCIDAEESERLDLSFDVIERVFSSVELKGWYGFGLALQAYQKRAWAAVDWLADLAQSNDRLLMLRLVKGAYWDSEIKRAQERGYGDYPLFTRKANTDLSYLAVAKKILGMGEGTFYPQFGTHNAYTVAAIKHLAGKRDFEFQRLHGMADDLFAQITPVSDGRACRVYAPVGSHQDLLAYLVRRLLENGANSSFVYKIADAKIPVAELLRDPVDYVRGLAQKPHPGIVLPKDLFQPERENAMGYDLSQPQANEALQQSIAAHIKNAWAAKPLLALNNVKAGEEQPITNPANRQQVIGRVISATVEAVAPAIDAAMGAFAAWQATPVGQRADCLRKLAVLLTQNRDEFLALLQAEGGKTIADAIAEWREAIDFCNYYAARAEQDFVPKTLPGPTGERNQLLLSGRGVFVCISPWNFPLAIFLGQITAALVAGNCVIAKSAEQTPLIAHRAVELCHLAGIPKTVLQFLPGDGGVVGAALCAHPNVAGVAFTGGTDTAQRINQTLAWRNQAAIPVLIAETGGQNAMIVDSSALPEQVVSDAISSAFQSAGQRCSALRVLYLQDEIYDKTVTMLMGAMAELTVGDPARFDADIGPVIDEEAQHRLAAHAAAMAAQGRILYQVKLSPALMAGNFFPPVLAKIDSIADLKSENFGPILHVVRYNAKDLDRVIDDVNRTGYGLTFGIHSRIQSTIDHITARIHAGNVYVNRNIIGAVVGVQPFGGSGLSGTGPKAGGPYYLHRFAVEKTLTADLTAAGGNPGLLNLGDDAT